MLPKLDEYLKTFYESSGFTMGSELCSELMNQQPENLVPSVYSLLAGYNRFEPIRVLNSKNEAEAEEYMNEATTEFKKKKNLVSLNYYTISIALMPSDSDLLYFAYAYRSAPLFQLKRYSACLMDINRALRGEAVLSEDMKSNLHERKRACVAALKQEKIDRYEKEKVMSLLTSESTSKEKEDKTKKERAEKREDDKSLAEQSGSSRTKKKKWKKYKKHAAKMEESSAIDKIDEEMVDPNYEDRFLPPRIPDPNEKIPSASAKVDIRFSEQYGRHLVATDDIKPGDVLLVERAYATQLYPQVYDFCCRYCYIRCEALIPCPNCLMGTYCSESCRSKAFDEFHRVECEFLYTLTQLNVVNHIHLALRLLLKATNQGASLSSMMQHPVYKSPMNILYGPIEGQYLSDDYNNVHNLMDHHAAFAPFDLFQRCCEVAVLLFLLKHTAFFGRPQGDDSEVDVENLSDAEMFTGTLLLKFLLVAMGNCLQIKHTVETLRLKPNDDDNFHCFLVGSGLYPLHSLLNHSCDPNTFAVNHRDFIVSYACQPINKGEQIFTAYHWNYANNDKNQRQALLKSEYFFLCQCRACESDWGRHHPYLGFPLKRVSSRISEKQLKDYERKFKIITEKGGMNATSEEDFDFLVDLITVLHRCVKLPCTICIGAIECLAFLLNKRGDFYDSEENPVVCLLEFSRGDFKRSGAK